MSYEKVRLHFCRNRIGSVDDGLPNDTFQEIFQQKNLSFLYDQKQLKIVGKWKKGTNQVQIVYQATPKQTLYFTNYENQPQIWTQGQGKYTSHWLPSVDDVTQKILFSVEVTYYQ